MQVVVIPSWYPTAERPSAGVYFHEQAVALREAGVGVAILYPELRSLKTLHRTGLKFFQISTADEQGVRVIRAKGINLFPFGRLRMRAWLKSAGRLMDRHVALHGKPDLIHAQSALYGGLAAQEQSRKFGVPYVIMEHCSYYARGLVKPWQQPLARSAFSSAVKVIAVSRALADALVKGNYTGPAEATIIPNMVNTEFFSLPTERRVAAPFKFLSLSLLERHKGIDLLLRAFARLIAGYPGATLEMAGEGSEMQSLRRLAATLGISDKVSFPGYLTRARVREAMWRANAFVHASSFETFGVVLIEAMSTGMPVVSTACGGPSEIVGPDDGILVPLGDEAGLAAAMRRIMAETGQFNAVKIRERTVRRFDRRIVSEQLIGVYRDVMSRVSSSPKA